MDIGSEYRASELSSALLYSQILKAKKIQKKRKYLWNKFNKIILDLKTKKFYLIKPLARSTSAYHLFVLVFKNSKLSFPNDKRVKLFILGDNNWQFFSHWPPVEVKPVTFYLNSQKNANVKNSDGSLEQEPIYKKEFDEYTYDPKNPVMSLMLQNSQTVPMDQRDNHYS